MVEFVDVPVGWKICRTNEVVKFPLSRQLQATRNHGQSFERLAERGGLTWREAAAIFTERAHDEFLDMPNASVEEIVRVAAQRYVDWRTPPQNGEAR